MTENQWPAAAPAAEDQYSGAGSLASDRSPSTKDAAKDEAANVARQAAAAAQTVAGTAKVEAGNVASEVKNNAKDLLHQAKSDLTGQAGTQQQKVAEGLRSISGELHLMADAPDQPGVASDLVRQAAEHSQSVASWLDARAPGSLLDEVKSFARQRPGTFLLLAAGAGVLAGRLGRSLQAGAPAATSATGTAMPPQPVTASTVAPTVGQPIGGQAGSGDVTYGETVYGEPARPGFAGPGTAGAPLRDPNDPYVDGGGRQL